MALFVSTWTFWKKNTGLPATRSEVLSSTILFLYFEGIPPLTGCIQQVQAKVPYHHGNYLEIRCVFYVFVKQAAMCHRNYHGDRVDDRVKRCEMQQR